MWLDYLTFFSLEIFRTNCKENTNEPVKWNVNVEMWEHYSEQCVDFYQSGKDEREVG
jgi:hypothetical protein